MGFADERLDYDAANCSIARTMSVVGDRWTIHVLREVFFGLRRFEDLHRAIGCARSILSERLATLVDEGLLTKTNYQEPGQRARPEYLLTKKGREFLPVIVALLDWGDRWTADPAGPAVQLRHKACGAGVHAELHCEAGHPVDAMTIEPVAGPGARRLTRT